MTKKSVKKPFWKRVAIDIAGFGMLIAVPFVGWIPGPGGIPLLLGGLALLAQNHEWAAKLLHTAKTRGTNFYEILFPDNKKVYLIYDFIGMLIVVGAVLLSYHTTRRLFDAIALGAVFFGAGLLLTNRKRIEKIVSFFLKKPKP